MMKKLIFILTTSVLMILVSGLTRAQQSPIFSQYDLNRYLINPAEAGSYGYTTYALMYREQWAGVPKSPSTFMLSGETRVLNNSFIQKTLSLKKKHKRGTKSGRVGVGGYIFNDVSGMVRRTGFQATYAYHIPMKMQQLSFAMSLQGFQYKIDKEELSGTPGIEDPMVENSKLNTFITEANFGARYSYLDFYAGFSIDNLMESLIQFGDKGNDVASLVRQYNFTAGYRYPISDILTLEPFVYFRVNESSMSQMLLSAKLYYTNNYWGGLAYRTSSGNGGWLIISLGLHYDKFNFGYAFDYTMGDIMKYSYGSHEFLISVEFGDNSRRYKWLQRY
jgi:type IX secretion system PorP/SprF family membrane protein